mmetsp:Transcript_13781/g.16647  ORF Transcript_13781/g.16647 Transcript_13781/m.16647 type:complete len:97 (+) Transcript_13781:802-1092(+)
MNTVNCRECGKETSVSRPSEDCFHCGAPTPWRSKRSLEIDEELAQVREKRNYHTRKFLEIKGLSAFFKTKELQHHREMEAKMIEREKELEKLRTEV